MQFLNPDSARAANIPITTFARHENSDLLLKILLNKTLIRSKAQSVENDCPLTLSAIHHGTPQAKRCRVSGLGGTIAPGHCVRKKTQQNGGGGGHSFQKTGKKVPRWTTTGI